MRSIIWKDDAGIIIYQIDCTFSFSELCDAQARSRRFPSWVKYGELTAGGRTTRGQRGRYKDHLKLELMVDDTDEHVCGTLAE